MTDPTDRDRTLSRVRTTTAVTGIGALVAGAALAGWWGYAAQAASKSPAAGTGSAGTGTGTADETGPGGLRPTEAPTATGSSGADEPAVTSGGS